MWTTSPPFSLAFLSWASVMGASEQPKSKVLAIICWMPAPEPIEL